ncbi:hypothetical protein [Blastococcus tunisiensis]|jgi:hypothetical protein|uniref:Uncharacterized protein n=1 Tax=Blastococcus tunisiensis TaxID=1798228 RepID=A0A1I2GLV2_9ACTN|nr:hypothetical protein [Blastococcus sp. DSM 46838]SFF17827.1 hypothetical protein SAMN05216574_109223 [Blastococcus sp. DSM 46838]
MPRSTRPRLLRSTAAAFAIAAASLTTVACGEDVVDDGVEQNIEEGVDDVEQEVDEGLDSEDTEG